MTSVFEKVRIKALVRFLAKICRKDFAQKSWAKHYARFTLNSQ